MSDNLLKKRFLNLIGKYSEDEKYNEICWAEVKDHYSERGRYYHNLNHLQNMLIEFDEVRDEIKEQDLMLFAVFYHDIIYQPAESGNEQKSALFFKRTISLTSFPWIKECMVMIERSKDHEGSSDPDSNFFLDIDLSILGQERKKYLQYCKNIRKEFSAVPNDVYVKERRKVLFKFLQKDRIFKSSFFNEKYEEKARSNIRFELENML